MRRFDDDSVIDFTRNREALARAVARNADDDYVNYVVPPPPLNWPVARSFFARRPGEKARPRRRRGA
jgi:hypothetical protein